MEIRLNYFPQLLIHRANRYTHLIPTLTLLSLIHFDSLGQEIFVEWFLYVRDWDECGDNSKQFTCSLFCSEKGRKLKHKLLTSYIDTFSEEDLFRLMWRRGMRTPSSVLCFIMGVRRGLSHDHLSWVQVLRNNYPCEDLGKNILCRYNR